MAQIVKDFMEYCGLFYQPETFGDLITWFTMTLCAFALLFGIVKLMFTAATQTRRLF